jgi:hypothetical protein
MGMNITAEKASKSVQNGGVRLRRLSAIWGVVLMACHWTGSTQAVIMGRRIVAGCLVLRIRGVLPRSDGAVMFLGEIWAKFRKPWAGQEC